MCRRVHLSAAPCTMMPSMPFWRMKAPRNPLAWEVPHMPVQAPMVVTEKVPEPHTLVPARGPVKKVSRFSGSDHSTPAGTSSHRYLVAKPGAPDVLLASSRRR